MKDKSTRTISVRNIPAIGRKPDTDGELSWETADDCVLGVCNTVIRLLPGPTDDADFDVRAELLRAMRDTHKAIRLLLGDDDAGALDPSALALTRTQVERVFLALLIHEDIDEDERWMRSCKIEEWRAKAVHLITQRLRYRVLMGFDDDCRKRLDLLITEAKRLGIPINDIRVFEDIVRSGNPDEKKRLRLPSLPDAAQTTGCLTDSSLTEVAKSLYAEYQMLNEWVHADLAAMVHSALRQSKGERGDSGWDVYRERVVFAPSLLNSYVSILCVTTLFGLEYLKKESVASALMRGWGLFIDSTEIGVLVWDSWAKRALGVLE